MSELDDCSELDAWIEDWKPIIGDHGLIVGLGGALSFDEYLDAHPNNIWTLVNHDGNYQIVSGMRWCNRESYFFTEKAYSQYARGYIVYNITEEDVDNRLFHGL